MKQQKPLTGRRRFISEPRRRSLMPRAKPITNFSRKFDKSRLWQVICRVKAGLLEGGLPFAGNRDETFAAAGAGGYPDGG